MFNKLLFGALLLLAPTVASAQTVKSTADNNAPAPVMTAIASGKSVASPANPCTILSGSTIVACTAANPLPVTLIGGGGSSTSTATAVSTAANPTYTEGATARPLSLDLTGYQRVRAKQDGSWTVSISGTPTIANTSFAATQSGAWNVTNVTGTVSLPTGAATAANQTTGNTSLASLTASLTTVGSTAPATAQFVAGVGPSGNARGLSTSTSGGLLPGQAAPNSTRTAITASTITTIDSARSGRLGLTVMVEGTLTANLYMCANGQSGTCSATVYDAMVPSGAVAGTVYTFMFGPTGAVYAFTTGTPTVNTTSWLAQ